MSLVLVTPPEPLVTLAQAKGHVCEESGDYDVQIGAFTAAATSAAQAWTGRAFMPQTWTYFAQGFPWTCDPAIKLPLRPLISVDEIRYTDQSGTDALWPVESYATYGVGSGYGGSILAVSGSYYPATTYGPESVRVTFTAGYENAAHPDLDLARAAVLLIMADLFANREAQTIASTVARVDNPTAANLLSPLRTWAA